MIISSELAIFVLLGLARTYRGKRHSEKEGERSQRTAGSGTHRGLDLRSAGGGKGINQHGVNDFPNGAGTPEDERSVLRMSLSANITKIIPPELGQILWRPRLLQLIEQNHEKKLVLILGQTAQGKTTLAASYIKTSKAPSAWVNLDREDSDPVNLFHLIVQSLQHALAGIDLPIPLSYPLEMLGEKADISLYRKWTQAIFEQISIPIRIVIDGLDRIPHEAPVFQLLQVLTEDSPPNVHLMMLSRDVPPLSLQIEHLKMRQQALVLTNQDLAFTQDEIREFFHKIRKTSFTADQLKKIFVATEGWIGGLILLSESLSRYSEDVRTKFISEELPDHFKKEVFEYFGREFFSYQPEHVQKFLVRTSVFDPIEPSFMKNLVGMENAEEILQGFAERNLFVQSIYREEKGWSFRFHQLFRNFLKAKFESELEDEERRSLLLEAARLYAHRNELENAVRYFLQVKAYGDAVPLIERCGMDLLKKGRTTDLSQWILSLPEEIIQGNPWLLFCLTMTRRFIAGPENVVSFLRAYSLFKQNGDTKGVLLSLAQLIGTLIYSGTHLAPLGPLIKEGETLLQSLDRVHYPYERAILWYHLGLGLILGEGDIRKGIRACQNAYLLGKQMKEIYVQAYALSFSALGLIFVGEFSSVNDICKRVEELVQKNVYSSKISAIHLMVNCVLAKSQGDFAKLQDFVQELRSEIEKFGFVYMDPWIYELLGSLSVSQGELAEAEEIAKSYLDTALSLKHAFFKGFALRMLGLIYLRQGELKKSKEVLHQSKKTLSEEAPSKYHLNRVKIMIGLVCTLLKEYKTAGEEFDEALHYFSSISSYHSLAETHFAMALLKEQQGKDHEAVPHLEKGFRIAEQRKYEFFYLLGTDSLTRVCLLALKWKVEEAMDYAGQLLSTRLSDVAEAELEVLSNHSEGRIKQKVREIRRTIHRRKAPRLRVQTLGGLRVFRGNLPMDESEWDRTQPKQLLKAILSYPSERVPKEVLLDYLWPEEELDAADANFRTTLRRLRKSLEPTTDKDFGSSYIHFYDDFVILDQELCQVDADLFLGLFRKGDERERGGDVTAALSLFNEALELYQGDFLPEEVYAPWAGTKRNAIREKYIELLSRMGNLYENQGALKKAILCHRRAIQADPILEDSYQKLMTLYYNKGKLNEALRVYEDCKRTLENELKTKPDPVTHALYGKILEKIRQAYP